jgi:HlyD family secretion protein
VNASRRPVFWLGGLLGAAVLVGGWYAVTRAGAPEGGAGDPTAYAVASARRGEVAKAVLATGRLTPWETVEVSSQVSGLVTAVHADFNAVVRKGDVLAEIDPSTFRQRLRQAEADLSAAHANHQVALLDVARQKDLLQRGLVTPQQYDHLSAELQQLAAILLSREAAVENVRLDLQRCLIVSPADGVVLHKAIEAGRTIAASMVAPTLFVIAQDLRRMRIIAPLNEVDVWLVRPGQRVRFSIEALRGREFSGRVLQIRNPYLPAETKPASASTPASPVTFDCVIEVENDDLLLRPGVTAIVSITVASEPAVVHVPNGAMNPRAAALPPHGFGPLKPGEAVVYRVPSPAAIPVPLVVTTGISDGLRTVVRSGLEEGDVVVVGSR